MAAPVEQVGAGGSFHRSWMGLEGLLLELAAQTAFGGLIPRAARGRGNTWTSGGQSTRGKPPKGRARPRWG